MYIVLTTISSSAIAELSIIHDSAFSWLVHICMKLAFNVCNSSEQVSSARLIIWIAFNGHRWNSTLKLNQDFSDLDIVFTK